MDLVEVIKEEWQTHKADLDRSAYFELMYNLIKALWHDQNTGYRIYNKIKHGTVILGSSKILNSENNDAPAVIYAGFEKEMNDHPLIVEELTYSEEELINLQNGVLEVYKRIRQLLAIYRYKNYPDYLTNKGFLNPLDFLRQPKPIK